MVSNKEMRFQIALNFNVDTAIFQEAVENVYPSHYFAQVLAGQTYLKQISAMAYET